MKLWFLTFEISPYFGGGLATYMSHILNMYNNTPHEIVVFARDPSISERIIEETYSRNITIIRFKGGIENYYKQFGYWPAISNEFAQHVTSYIKKLGAPDVIEAADGYGIAYVCLQKKLTLDPLFKEIKFITVAHTPTYYIDRLNLESEYRLPVYWTRQVERFTLAAADGVIWPSQLLSTRLSKEVDLKHPLQRLIRNPFQMSPAAKSSMANESRDHFFVASRLAYWKGVTHAIGIMEPLWRDGSNVSLKIWGSDTPYHQQNMQMSEFIRKRFGHYISKNLIELCGNHPREEINIASERAYAQIHPSIFDNFPYSAIEGIEAGNITVLNSSVGLGEILEDGKDCVKIDVNDLTSSAEALRLVLAMSETGRSSLLESAKERIRSELNYQRIMGQRHEFFQDVINRNGTKRFPFLSTGARPLSKDSKANSGLLSVVIPFFNMGAYVEETVRSVYNSSYPNKEIIIVDDGSTNSVDKKIAAEVAERYGARLIRTANQGAAAARNTGVAESTGEFVALLDSDDYVSFDYYSKAIRVLEQYDNVAFVGCWIRDFNTKGTIRVWTTHNTELPTQVIFNLTNCQALVCKRGAFIEAGEHDINLKMFLDDWEGTISLISKGYFGVMLPEALFHYRIRDDSIFRSRKTMWITNYEYIVEKHSKLFASHAPEIIKFLNANGPNYLYHLPGFPSELENMIDKSSIEPAKKKKSWRSRKWRAVRDTVRDSIPLLAKKKAGS
jgi:glycosyltransferase involved in cell wall biosynthesis